MSFPSSPDESVNERVGENERENWSHTSRGGALVLDSGNVEVYCSKLENLGDYTGGDEEIGFPMEEVDEQLDNCDKNDDDDDGDDFDDVLDTEEEEEEEEEGNNRAIVESIKKLSQLESKKEFGQYKRQNKELLQLLHQKLVSTRASEASFKKVYKKLKRRNAELVTTIEKLRLEARALSELSRDSRRMQKSNKELKLTVARLGKQNINLRQEIELLRLADNVSRGKSAAAHFADLQAENYSLRERLIDTLKFPQQKQNETSNVGDGDNSATHIVDDTVVKQLILARDAETFVVSGVLKAIEERLNILGLRLGDK